MGLTQYLPVGTGVYYKTENRSKRKYYGAVVSTFDQAVVKTAKPSVIEIFVSEQAVFGNFEGLVGWMPLHKLYLTESDAPAYSFLPDNEDVLWD